jgi:hypothetical protein
VNAANDTVKIMTVASCSNVRAERLRAATVPTVAPPAITEGSRFVMRDVPGEPVLICADPSACCSPTMRAGSS